MLTGLSFLLVGLLILGKEIFILEEVNGERNLIKKDSIYRDRNLTYRLLVSTLSLLIGVFRIIASIIY